MDPRDMQRQATFYSTLTAEEKARTYPCKRAKCMMMSSGDSTSVPSIEGSVAPKSLDMVDDARPAKIISAPPSKTSKSTDTDPEVIEEVPIGQKTLPMPEPKPTIERNGIDAKKSPDEDEDDSCLINCIYYTQQCCECTIS